MRMKKMLAAAIAALGLAAVGSEARADTLKVGFDSATAVSGGVVFQYSAIIEEQDGVGGRDSRLVPGNFFTIYDFGAVNPFLTTIPLNWTLTQTLVGVTPVTTNPADDPLVANATLTYTGPAVDAPANLGTFLLGSSTLSISTTTDNYTSTDIEESLQNDGSEDTGILVPAEHIGITAVPSEPFPVPTPIAASGAVALIGLIAAKRRHR
jgi:hypothetical protein